MNSAQSAHVNWTQFKATYRLQSHFKQRQTPRTLLRVKLPRPENDLIPGD